MEIVRRRVLVSGRVQGVWFRRSTADIAELSGVSGWVRNLPDGRVEAIFEGDRGAVGFVVDWCSDGPPAARVEAVDVVEEEPQGVSGFRVRD